MPRLLEKTKKIREKRFLDAMAKTGSATKAALEVLDIGSRGSKDIQNSASAAGSQMLERIKPSLLEAYQKRGITVEKVANTNFELMEDEKAEVRVKATDMAIKVGVGGGYAAQRMESMNVNINATPKDFNKFDKLKDEYEKKLLDEIGNAEA